MLSFRFFVGWILVNFHILPVLLASNRGENIKELSTDVVNLDFENPESATPTPIQSQPSAPRLKHFTTNTLLINQEFHQDWVNILAALESLLPTSRPSFFNSISSETRQQAQSRLINGIRNNDKNGVYQAIRSGARFLSIDPNGQARTCNYYPIEYAVVLGSTRALIIMFDQMRSIDKSLLKNFYGGLLVRAVQAGQFETIKFLISCYKAPYLKGSFLLQQAIMHQVPVSIIKYILANFQNEPELLESYGKHADFPLHLAVRYNNHAAFQYLHDFTIFEKNQLNGDSLRPINLVFALSRVNFVSRLFSKHPHLRLNWTDEFGCNLLHLAVLNGNDLFVQMLIESFNFPINCLNYDAQSPLHISIPTNSRPIALYLIEKGANVLQQDKHFVSPLLMLARVKYLEVFNLAAESLKFKSLPTTILRNFVQILFNEALFEYIEVLLAKFPNLRTESFSINLEQFNQLINSEIIFDMPNLVEIFIKTRLINPNLFVHKAVASGKVPIVRLLLSYGAVLNLPFSLTGETPIDVAIKHKHAELTRFLLSLGGWTINNNCPLDFFEFALTNGGSFHPSSSSKLIYFKKSVILGLFIDYFTKVYNTRILNIPALTAICLQLEIFIFYHIRNHPLTDEMISALRVLQSVKSRVANLFDERTETRFPLLKTLLDFFSQNNFLFLRGYLNIRFPVAISSLSDFLAYVDPFNQYLIAEYNSIL